MLIKSLIYSKNLSERKDLIPLKVLEKMVKKELKKGNEGYIPYILSELAMRALTHMEEMKTIREYSDRIVEIQQEHVREVIENSNEEITETITSIN